MEKALLMHIGTRVRKLREMKGYSQDYVASQLGMTQTNYSKIERGETKDMTVTRLEEIAKVLEVPPSVILSFDEKQVFTSTFNNQGGSYGGNIMYIQESFNREREQYEARLKDKDEEIAFLRERWKSGK